MARWQSSVSVAGVLIVLTTLAGCADRTPTRAPQTATNASRLITPGDEYVAIGDSYTAAPLNSPPVDRCLQSTTNYPHKVAAALRLRLKDVSCSGASTQNFAEGQVLGTMRRPPQANALSPATDLVTISLGANDSNAFAAVVLYCASVRHVDPSGAPCQKADAARGSGALEKETAATERRLVTVIRQAARRAPDARIVVVGYPEFFPAAGPCAQLPMALGDYAFAHRINEAIVRAQQRAAATTNVDYLDVFDATRGHNMCARNPWIAGAKPTRPNAAPYHPYPHEQQLIASRLATLLTRVPPPKQTQRAHL